MPPRIQSIAATRTSGRNYGIRREVLLQTNCVRTLETLRDKRYEFLSDGTSYPAADEAA
jgi:hypothetical protein